MRLTMQHRLAYAYVQCVVAAECGVQRNTPVTELPKL